MTAVKRETVGALKDPLWFGNGYRHHGGLHYDTPTQKVLDTKCAWCGKDATDHFHLGKTEIPLCIWHNNQAVNGTLRFIAHEGKVYGQVEQTSTEITAWYRYVMDVPKVEPPLEHECVCAECGETFMSARKTKYCSASCRGKRKRRKQEERERKRLRSGVCQVCGEKFTYTYKGTVRLTCSRQCQIRLLNLPTSILIKCSECGKEAWVKLGPLGNHTLTCSKECHRQRASRISRIYRQKKKEEAAITAASHVNQL